MLSRKIERNIITFLKGWEENTFVECSEDLRLRIFDVRDSPFKPSIEISGGTNFATNCDILGS